MKIHLSTLDPAQLETDALIVLAIDGGDKDNNKPQLQAKSDAFAKAAADLIASKEITGKLLEIATLHKPEGVKAKRLIVVGVGKAKSFTSYELRKAAGAAVRALKKSVKSAAIVAPENWGGAADPSTTSTLMFERGGLPEAVKAIAEGAVVANPDYNYYHSDRKTYELDELTILVPANGHANDLEAAMKEGHVIGESQNFTRDLVNEPGNRMTPTILGQRAKKMAEEVGIQCDVYSTDFLHEKKMGAFWSVSQGSEEPPALIVMKYEPAGAPQSPVLGLVGKGITFDTGGISIKPADGMEKMKYDMAGGAAMIGAMRAIALLKPNVRVIGVVCAAENMPSGKAQKPGDVQIAMSGKSIEIINTDAEGRLVLADGLHYAKQLGATHLIDAATLTGACMVALGGINAGVFANDEDYFNRFAEALKKSGEKMWRLPIDDDYKELIKSPIADIKNTGGRYGGAITAAMFLKEFVGETPWIHLDIAGVAWQEEAVPFLAKGPSGIAVRSIIELVQSFG
ncbi:Leucyl aminopeptidase [Candidatus Koribacter versatilis Ellin345]|uniref:Probable cytosol aminopeptidase n=1 Tax=Koribacter versatilis (strain Ellin345) TaxID=204669 RepID=AMPA_KORVE|nr:leucyl aminopeptidase [Candidatus Koribacter versatilis]Q1IPU7.1 RecName: Full=Probable cytosol aminopeptidase; AltName: Full=Leucine aminopeptidase; Short=LAP; AltName: Full=Leucyl aminopeptidase [Candidatus Koribacter versatilis Ellin345]ABF41103.1 Leucyl aminopeptidase [Candidatus Koribacter versatilis Ellin345]